MQMSLPKNKHVVQAFPPHTPQEPFAERIRLGRTIRRLQDFDRRPDSDSREGFPLFAIAIPNQETRSLTKGRRLA